MSVQSHIKSLNNKINDLEQQIHESDIHHKSSVDLKKRRLQLLDEIEKLTHPHKQNAA